MDLERKARITQAFINQKENQATEKDIILEELTELLETSTIQGALKLVKGIELSKKLNDTVRQRITTSRALVATISELALVQVLPFCTQKLTPQISAPFHWFLSFSYVYRSEVLFSNAFRHMLQILYKVHFLGKKLV